MSRSSTNLITYVGLYVVGIYALQRFVLQRPLGIPGFLDPLGMWLGYPAGASVLPTAAQIRNVPQIAAPNPPLQSAGDVLSTIQAPTFDFGTPS